MYFFSSEIASFASFSLRSRVKASAFFNVCRLLLESRILQRLLDEEVLDQLLGDRGCTLLASLRAESRQGGAHDTRKVDAAVRVETAVLAIDGSVLRRSRDLVPCDLLAILIEDGGDWDFLTEPSLFLPSSA